MNAITSFLYDVLAWINGIVGNYGVAIIVFTFLMRMVCMPFDYRSRKGMRKMQLMQPKLDALQKKYGNDKQKFQQKQAELMRKEHYNPLSGCLPMLLTWPLMIAMFTAMRSIANERLVVQCFRYLLGDASPVLNTERFLWIKNVWVVDSPFNAFVPDANSLQFIPKDVWQQVYSAFSETDLAAIAQSLTVVPGAVLDFSSDAAMKTSVAAIVEALQHVESYTAACQWVPGWKNMNLLLFSVTLYKDWNGLLILPVLAGVTQILQTKLNPAEQQNTAANNDKQNSTAKFMKWFFPILSVYFCLTSNAGFAIYWVASNVVTGAQSIVITKMLEHKDKKEEAKKLAQEGTK